MVKKLFLLGLLFFGLSQSPIFGQYVLESDIPLQYSSSVTPLRECVDKALQNKLIQELNANPKWKKLIADKKMAVGLVDLRNLYQINIVEPDKNKKVTTQITHLGLEMSRSMQPLIMRF